mmetsp:Transcript_5678/g.8001  ORF Transcript_5678/g.8001 Transcript_5678/m.8001 type:complete len:92 (-) Transcript_5678:860-1135(-)
MYSMSPPTHSISDQMNKDVVAHRWRMNNEAGCEWGRVSEWVKAIIAIMYVGYVVRSGLAKSVPSFLLPALPHSLPHSAWKQQGLPSLAPEP